jgi:hypothetical protein
MGGAVLWAETPDEERGETSEPETQAEVDDTFAVRRLRRWIKGMFGGAAGRPVDDTGAIERAPGEPEGSPGARQERND